MKIAFTSRRPFPDGPVRQPFLENDPANIAYVLGGDYFSFLSLGKLSNRQIVRRLEPYDLVFVALDHRNIDIVERVTSACEGRLATYSEGGIGDYQMHSPAGQYTFLRLIDKAAINFLYWEKYVPFYRSLTSTPVEYLPYPYLVGEAEKFRVPLSARARHVTLPSGLSGRTRNGLSSLSVGKSLLQAGLISRINCWLSTPTSVEDARVIRSFLCDTSYSQSVTQTRFNWRQWLHRSRIDYRPLLRLKNRLFRRSSDSVVGTLSETDTIALYTRQAWPRYLAEVADSLIVIDMNNRETVGRNALDCAALGIACVSTDRSDMPQRLFPELTLEDSWDVKGAVTICERLLGDASFYQSVIDYAFAALGQYPPQSFRRRFQAILERHEHLRRLRTR